MFHGAIKKNNNGMFYGPRYMFFNSLLASRKNKEYLFAVFKH